MGDIEYNTDKLAIAQQQEAIAIEKLAEVEQNCNASPVAFIKENYQFKKIRERKEEVGIKTLIGITLTKVCALAGIKTEIDTFTKQDLVKMILSAYNELSLEEIYKAFELERYFVYGDKTDHFQLFNADYVSSVLKKYRKWKQETKQQHNISPPQNLPEVSESQKKEIVNNGIIRVFNEFKETGVIPEPNAYIFDELYERKLIKDAETPNQQLYYQEKFNQAAKEIQQELKSVTIQSQNDLRTVREELDKITNNSSDKVAVRCKRLILTDYFNKLIKENIEIESVLI